MPELMTLGGATETIARILSFRLPFIGVHRQLARVLTKSRLSAPPKEHQFLQLLL
jgi:hypothetical protein